MKKYLLSVAILIFKLSLAAQVPVPYLKSNRKYIYVDSASQKPVFDKEFDDARLFSEGLASVKIDGGYSYIDATGKLITDARYENSFDFKNGMGRVYLQYKHTFIDKTGKELFPLKYYLNEFSEGLAGAGYSGKFGFINKTGNEVIACQYDGINNFSEGLAMVKLNNKFGFVNNKGTVVIPIKYDKAESFANGVAVVSIGDKYGYVDKTGKEIIPLKYSYAYTSLGNLLKVETDSSGKKKNGYLDKTGKIIFPFKYTLITEFGKENFLVVNNNTVQIINRKNQALVTLNQFDYWSTVSEDLALLQLKQGGPDAGKFMLVNNQGKIVSPLMFEDGGLISNGVFSVKSNDKWGHVDKTGKLINNCLYDATFRFQNDFARVKKKDYWFFVNKKGIEYRDKIPGSSVGWLLFEEFKNNNNKWHVDTTADKTVTSNLSKTNEGLYWIKNSSLFNGQFLTRKINQLDGSHKLSIEINMQMDLGDKTSGMGLLFGSDDKDENFYLFLVNLQRQFTIVEYKNKKFNPISQWKDSRLIRGHQGYNKLGVVHRNNKWSFYINQVKVFEMDNLAFHGNRAGYYIDPSSLLRTNSFMVYDWTLEEQAQEKNIDRVPSYEAEIFDDFTDNSNKWDYLSSEKGSSSIFGGYYELVHKVKGRDYLTLPIYHGDFRAATIKLRAEQTSGDTTMPYGMCFGKQDAGNNFLFLINNSKKFMIGAWDNGVWKVIKDWTNSDAIRIGQYFKTVSLELETRANTWIFKINGKIVYECEAREMYSNQYGMYVEDIQTLRFHHFSIVKEKNP